MIAAATVTCPSAAHEAELADRQGDDLDRRDRQRRAEKQGRHKPLLGVGQHAVRQHFAERHTAGERHRDAGEGHAGGGSAGAADQRQVGLHAGQQQQHQDAELGDRPDHRGLFLAGREQSSLQLRRQRAKHARPQQDAGDQLAHDRRLADPLHRLAEQPAADQQQDDLGQEDDFRWSVLRLGRGRGRERHHSQRQGQRTAESPGADHYPRLSVSVHARPICWGNEAGNPIPAADLRPP